MFPLTLGTNVSKTAHIAIIDYFKRILEIWRGEKGERFQQDIRIMEERYHGRWGVNLHADYCWNLKQDAVADEHRKKSPKIRFIPY